MSSLISSSIVFSPLLLAQIRENLLNYLHGAYIPGFISFKEYARKTCLIRHQFVGMIPRFSWFLSGDVLSDVCVSGGYSKDV